MADRAPSEPASDPLRNRGGRPLSPAFHLAMAMLRAGGTIEAVLQAGVSRRTAFRAKERFHREHFSATKDARVARALKMLKGKQR